MSIASLYVLCFCDVLCVWFCTGHFVGIRLSFYIL